MPSIQPQGKFGEFRLIISPRTSCRHRAFRSDFICKAGDGSRACVRWHLPALGLRNDQTLVRPNKIDEPRRRTYPPRRANRRRDVHDGCQRPGGWACLGVARRRIHRRERRRPWCATAQSSAAKTAQIGAPLRKNANPQALAALDFHFLRNYSVRQAALFLMSDSAGMPSPSCSRQIILSVSGRLRLSTSCTRFRLPMKGMRSRG